MVNKIIKVLVLLPAVLCIFTGVRWLVAPSDVAATLGLGLSEGLGRSSLIGDMSGFFLTLGSCMLIALITERRAWYFPAMMLLGVAVWFAARVAFGVAMAGDRLALGGPAHSLAPYEGVELGDSRIVHAIRLVADRTGVTGSTLTHHVKILASAGLVTQARQGRSIICAAVAFDEVQELSNFLLTECCADSPDTDHTHG